MSDYFFTVRGMGIEDADNGLLEQNPSREGKSYWTKFLGEGGWKQKAIKQQKRLTRLLWSSFTGKFIKRFALLLLLKLMNETVTDIYFYNFIFKVLVFARHQAEPLLFNCQELWWDFLSSTKSLVFGSINTFMLYQQILRLFSPFGNFLKIISFLKLLSHGCMYTIRINFQVPQSSSSDGGFFMVVIFSFLPQCLQNLNNFHFWNISVW